MPRFAVLEHDHPQLHWDLLLEAGTILRTWRLTAPPTRNAVIVAAASFDHRLLYLDYEGPISGGRGSVQRWDGGSYEGDLPTAVPVGGQLQLRFAGQRLCGVVILERLGAEDWRLKIGGCRGNALVENVGDDS